jgi:hypothetical protein
MTEKNPDNIVEPRKQRKMLQKPFKMDYWLLEGFLKPRSQEGLSGLCWGRGFIFFFQVNALTAKNEG